VPRQRMPTTRLGVRVLLDHTAAMAPFRSDLRMLVDALRHVVGQESVTVSTTRGVLSPAASSDGVRLLAATDLGVSLARSTISPRDWIELARNTRAAGGSLVVLCPYPPERWPPWVAHMAVVHWDRPTSVRTVQRILRRRR
jgi:hypothetical protein